MFGQDFPEGVDELHFQVHGVVKDVERLKGMCELFAETLNTLCDIGSAYETRPEGAVDIPDADRLLRSSALAQGDTLVRPASGTGTDDLDKLPRPADAPQA
jgi:hypothetical protein